MVECCGTTKNGHVMIEKMDGGLHNHIPGKTLQHKALRPANKIQFIRIITQKAQIIQQGDLMRCLLTLGGQKDTGSRAELPVSLGQSPKRKHPIDMTHGEMQGGILKFEQGGHVDHPFDQDGAVGEEVAVANVVGELVRAAVVRKMTALYDEKGGVDVALRIG